MSYRRTLLAACALACAGAAQALPTTTLSFVQATGTVGKTDSIEVWLRLTIEAPIAFNSSQGAPFGLDAADLPTEGYDYSVASPQLLVFATYTRAYTNTAFGCGSDFTSSSGNTCDGGAYEFDFHTDGTDPTKPSFNWLETLNLQAGSYDYLFGVFKPVAPEAGKTYTFSSAYFSLNFEGFTADGVHIENSYDFTSTCAGGEAGCEFTRTVVADVPEPAGYAMLLAGLIGVAAAAARRRA